MTSLARVVSTIFVLALFAAGCGGDPPDKEMQQAQGAIDAARVVGADRYASDEFKAAIEALTQANDAVAQRDYRLALNYALDSRERAQNAALAAADGKAAARVTADHEISAATARLEAARSKLPAAADSRTPSPALKALHVAMADAEQRLQEARTAFDSGDYTTVSTATTAADHAIAKGEAAFEAAAPPAARRRVNRD